MDNSLLKRYREYARTEEAFAVLFVKQHLSQSRGHWVDISSCRQYEMSSDRLHFRFVTGGLYKRKIHPQYPPKSSYTTNGKFDKDGYDLMVRAITWEAAHKDIEQQKSRRVKPVKFMVRNLNRSLLRVLTINAVIGNAMMASWYETHGDKMYFPVCF